MQVVALPAAMDFSICWCVTCRVFLTHSQVQLLNKCEVKSVQIALIVVQILQAIAVVNMNLRQ